uniref:Uncharacterized protein n=1 Tax=Glossina pallidipes TaxID=7398 RepID=A0A1A9ZCR5_GLOPL
MNMNLFSCLKHVRNSTLEISEKNPHEPTQGSSHFCRIQALVEGHSGLMVHSGLQLGGVPMNECAQEQAGLSPTTLHSELGPHGEGIQGSIGSIGSVLLVSW